MKVYVKENSAQPYVDNMIIDCVELTLEQSANFRALYQNAQDIQLNVEYVLMEGANYEAWGDSDQYVIDYVLANLGFEERDGYDS